MITEVTTGVVGILSLIFGLSLLYKKVHKVSGILMVISGILFLIVATMVMYQVNPLYPSILTIGGAILVLISVIKYWKEENKELNKTRMLLHRTADPNDPLSRYYHDRVIGNDLLNPKEKKAARMFHLIGGPDSENYARSALTGNKYLDTTY